MLLRLGTRASALARCQADWVAGQLRASGIEVELVPITTSGDQASRADSRHRPRRLHQGNSAGTVGKADRFGRAQPEGPAHRHSAGVVLAAVPKRAPCGDVLISPAWKTLEQLPAGATVGTSSMRRRAQLLHSRPDLHMKEIRGNIDTRLRKLHQGEYDALILAEAGLARLGLAGEITQSLPMSVILPAVGQGALGLETRRDDEVTRHSALRD